MRIKINDGYCEWEYDVKFEEAPSISEVIHAVEFSCKGKTERYRMTKAPNLILKDKAVSLLYPPLKIKNKTWEVIKCSTK